MEKPSALPLQQSSPNNNALTADMVNDHNDTNPIIMTSATRKYEQHRLKQYFSTAAHICSGLYTCLVLYLSFFGVGDFVFFTWHPILLSIGWMFLMTEAVLTISKDNLLTRQLNHGIRVKYHWIMQTVAVVLISVGFAIVYINKDNMGKTHIKTWHALFGLMGLIGAVPTCLNGVAALYSIDLKRYVRPKILKCLHVVSGVLTFTFGGLSLILSVYTNWFAKKTNQNEWIFLYALTLVTVAVIFTIFKPILNVWAQIKTQR